MYYLTIAYISTLRNWTNLFGFKVSRFLFYYRLVGAVLFELSQLRIVLLIFPNTFEYFFDFYEIVRLRWDPRRLSRGVVLRAAALIWIVIKLPQEYVIHVAQVSSTEWIKVNIFGAEPGASWGSAIANRPLVSVALIVVVVALILTARWLLAHRLPPADRRPRLAADPIPDHVAERSAQIGTAMPALRITETALIEKVALVSLVTVIFAEVLPGVRAGVLVVTLGVALVIVANTALSMWLARRGRSLGSTGREFVGLAVLNTFLILLYAALLPYGNGSINAWHSLFFSLLLTLIVTLYDRYRSIHVARFEKER